MDPFSIAMLGSSVLSFFGQIGAGGAARASAELNAYGAMINAYNIETERELARVEAMQRHNDRLEQYRSNLSANIASFAASGRDIGGQDRSVAAFLERQKEIATSDTARSDFMAEIQKMQLTSQAAGERARAYGMRAEGRAAQQSAVIGAFTTLAGGLYRYNQVRANLGTSAPTYVSGPMTSTSVRPRARPF